MQMSLERSFPLRAAFLGGLLFVVIFYVRGLAVPDHFYQMRDDGVITLSHARNWIDYGFIGTNPSGPRVEGYSAPLQFFIYSALYALTGLSFDTYIALQTWGCTFLLGACFIGFFSGDLRQRAGAATVGAVCLAGLSTFFEWHGSGMENALTHVTFLATLLLLYRGKITLWHAVIPWLAALSRLESVYYIAPLLVLFCAYQKTPRAMLFTGIVFTGWLMLGAWRYWYFGSLIPNTALAQGLDLMDRIQHWPHSLRDMTQLAPYLWLRHGLAIALLCAPLMWVLPREKHMAFLAAMIVCTALLMSAHPFFFGYARLDAARTTTHCALVAALAIAMLISSARNASLALFIPVFALALTAAMASKITVPYYVCCHADEFTRNLRDFQKAALDEHIPRASIANPDLGRMSWEKRFNIVDMGKIGSPIIAALTAQFRTYDAATDYLFEFAAPDMIESHSSWGCSYGKFFHDPRFRDRYQTLRETIEPHKCAGGERVSGLWIRKDMLAASPSPERALVDSLVRDLSTQRIADALASCEADAHANCAYVARSAYRFLPEFRARGMLAELTAIFAHSKRNTGFNLYMITGSDDATAYKAALADITR